MIEIPEQIVAALKDVMTYVGETKEWVVVKKEVMKQLQSHLRKNFSTRHPKTKLHSFNELELEIVKWWQEHTGNVLVISPPLTKEQKEKKADAQQKAEMLKEKEDEKKKKAKAKKRKKRKKKREKKLDKLMKTNTVHE